MPGEGLGSHLGVASVSVPPAVSSAVMMGGNPNAPGRQTPQGGYIDNFGDWAGAVMTGLGLANPITAGISNGLQGALGFNIMNKLGLGSETGAPLVGKYGNYNQIAGVEGLAQQLIQGGMMPARAYPKALQMIQTGYRTGYGQGGGGQSPAGGPAGYGQTSMPAHTGGTQGGLGGMGGGVY